MEGVYSRAILLFTTETEAVRPIHQVCCHLDDPAHDLGLNFQMNRWLTWIGEHATEDLHRVASRIIDYDDWKREMLALHIVASVLRTGLRQRRDRLALLVALQRSPPPLVADLRLPGPARAPDVALGAAVASVTIRPLRSEPLGRRSANLRAGHHERQGAMGTVIEVEPAEALADEPVALKLRGLPPGRQVVVKAEARLGAEPPWRSQAELVADASGVVDLARHAPEAGSYRGIEPMGLFWSMLPEPGASSLVDLYSTLDPLSITLTTEIEGRAVARQSLRRFVMSPDVVRTRIRDDGLVATLFHPSGGGPHPGIIVLGGSEGGLVETPAAFLASHGYAALALAYFGTAHLPRSLCLVPLEYFRRAIDWMTAHAAVAGSRVAVVGGSRGGELALLLGATFPAVAAVVGSVPSGVVTFGIGANPSCFFRSSWSLARRPMPFVPMRLTSRVLREIATLIVSRRPIEIRIFYDAAMANGKAVAAATIPVERTRGPLLLLSGTDDRMWRSSRLAQIAIERLDAHRHPYPYAHVSYPGCGHFLLSLPNYPVLTSLEHPRLRRPVILGGSRQGNARASVDAWSRSLAFLAEHVPWR